MTLNSISDCSIFLQASFIEDDLMIMLTLVGVLYLVLFIMRLLRFMKKRTCPSCSGKLSRKKRNALDKLIIIVTLSILPFRRYKCIHCGWEGLRWSTKR